MICVKKEGRVCTVYLDAGGRPMPFNDFHSPPPGFPFTAGELEIAARYPGEEMTFITEHREPNPVSTLVVSDEDIQRLTEGKTPMPTARPKAVPSAPRDGVEDTLVEMLRRYKYAKGKEAKQLKADLEAVATFLIDAAVYTEEQLSEIKERELAERKRFSL